MATEKDAFSKTVRVPSAAFMTHAEIQQVKERAREAARRFVDDGIAEDMAVEWAMNQND